MVRYVSGNDNQSFDAIPFALPKYFGDVVELIDTVSAVVSEIADGSRLALILIKVAQIPGGYHQAGVRFGVLASNTGGRCLDDIVKVSRAGIISLYLLIVHGLEAARVHAI